MSEKNYCGSGKTRKGKFGDFFSLSIDMQKANSMALKKGRYLNLIVSPRKEKDAYGNDLTVYQDTFEPVKQEEQKQDEKTDEKNDGQKEDLPF